MRTTEYYGYISDEALLSLDSMEGLQSLPRSTARAREVTPVWPGYAVAACVAGAAYGVHLLPCAPFQTGSGAGARRPVSAAMIAMLGGMAVRNLMPLPGAAVEGAKRVARVLIPITIGLTGAGLDLASIAAVEIRSVVITVLCVGLAAFTAIRLGKLLGVWPKTALLIGAGTAICGTSAIMAVAPLIEAEDQDLVLSIGTVNILGLVLMFAFPALGSLLQMRDDVFGVWAGTSIHAVPQVVAAGFAYSPAAGELATLVKLVRVTLLAPFLFAVGYFCAKRVNGPVAMRYSSLVPSFLWGFVTLAAINTLGLFPVLQFRFGSAPLSGLLANLSELLLTLSMAAMGMEVNVRFFARVGGRAVLTGIGASLTLCCGSLLLIRLLL